MPRLAWCSWFAAEGVYNLVFIKEIKFGSDEYKKGIALRETILREPIGIRFLEEELAQESAADTHIAAFLTGSNDLVGCLILSRSTDEIVKMRQVAVAANSQGLGVGKKMVAFFESKAIALNFEEIQLNARESALQFYLSLGYTILGDRFDYVIHGADGKRFVMPHYKMTKKLRR